MPFCAPQIVYSNKLVGQTTALSEALLTPSSDGIFRINLSLGNVTLATSDVVISVDINGMQQYLSTAPLAILGYVANFRGQVAVDINTTIALQGGQPITLVTELVLGTAFSPYDIQVVIEQIA